MIAQRATPSPRVAPEPEDAPHAALAELELARAEAAAHADHVRLGPWLLDHELSTAEEKERALAARFGCPFLHIDASATIPETLREHVHAPFLLKISAAPIEQSDEHVVVVLADPSNLESIDALQAMIGHRKLLVRVGFAEDIVACINRSYAPKSPMKNILRQLGDESPSEREAERAAAGTSDEADGAAEVTEADSAVIKLASQVIIEGLQRGASDIHIEPNGPSRPMRIRLRIDGDCVDYQEVPPRFRRALVARFKIMARLDISERRRPQDGKINFNSGARKTELRVATYPTAGDDEDVVMRILPEGGPIPLDAMHMSAENLNALRTLIRKPYGLVLCVGPTGSGKTTTLHSVLGELNGPDLKICTVEDPVEITQAGLRQVQVRPRIGLDFGTVLRSFLRADPDVIMVGEMRDHETAQIAVEASLTGHLVLSTIHTNTAPETITRLVEMGLDPFTFADSLLGVIAQRLVRALCPHCRERCAPGGDEHRRFDALLRSVGRAPAALPPWRGVGCAQCGGKGYRGRLALHELLVVDDALRRAIGNRAPIEELRRLAGASGMHTLLEDGLTKIAAGLTDLRQVLSVCSR
ncbi:MAG: type II/IV secretion system protein [Deltaproteobacteria bacterium]|nr:type II/IV secretion system protein [Deltaproteobacteria bacterium]